MNYMNSHQDTWKPLFIFQQTAEAFRKRHVISLKNSTYDLEQHLNSRSCRNQRSEKAASMAMLMTDMDNTLTTETDQNGPHYNAVINGISLLSGSSSTIRQPVRLWRR